MNRPLFCIFLEELKIQKYKRFMQKEWFYGVVFLPRTSSAVALLLTGKKSGRLRCRKGRGNYSGNKNQLWNHVVYLFR